MRDALDEFIAGLEEEVGNRAESVPDNPTSPARSARGNLRNLKSMSEAKFVDLYQTFYHDELLRDSDPEAWDALVTERIRRGGA